MKFAAIRLPEKRPLPWTEKLVEGAVVPTPTLPCEKYETPFAPPLPPRPGVNTRLPPAVEPPSVPPLEAEMERFVPEPFPVAWFVAIEAVEPEPAGVSMMAAFVLPVFMDVTPSRSTWNVVAPPWLTMNEPLVPEPPSLSAATTLPVRPCGKRLRLLLPPDVTWARTVLT